MIRTDADSDLTNSLDHCLMMLALARGDPRNGQWCLIAAYSAAQTAMVMVLEAQGDWKPFKPEDREKLRKFFDKLETDESIPSPQVELNTFRWLVENWCSEASCHSCG